MAIGIRVKETFPGDSIQSSEWRYDFHKQGMLVQLWVAAAWAWKTGSGKWESQ